MSDEAEPCSSATFREQVAEAMPEGRRNQQMARDLALSTIEGRHNAVKAFTRHADAFPWQWSAQTVDEWPGDLRAVRHLKQSTLRDYAEAVRSFCAFLTWARNTSRTPANTGALLLNRLGGRLSTRSVDTLLDELAADTDLVDESGHPTASAHTLRHTFGTNLTRSKVDVVTLAQLMGHKRLDTTRRYAPPTEADMEAAVGLLPTDE